MTCNFEPEHNAGGVGFDGKEASLPICWWRRISGIWRFLEQQARSARLRTRKEPLSVTDQSLTPIPACDVFRLGNCLLGLLRTTALTHLDPGGNVIRCLPALDHVRVFVSPFSVDKRRV